MSYPPSGGGYAYPPAGGAYPPQQPPYGQQPAYGQPPYPGGPPQPAPYGAPQQPQNLGFEKLNIQSNQPGGMPMPDSSYGQPTGSCGPPPGGYGQPPYSSQAPAAAPYGQPQQQPSFGSVAYAATAAVNFQQGLGHNQPSYGQPQHPSYTPQAAPERPSPPQRPPPPKSSQSHSSSGSVYQHQSGGSANPSQKVPQEPVTQGTVKDYSSFSEQQDAEALRKAMKGLGTDEKTITRILGSRSNDQRQRIKIEFATLFGKDLIKELKSELSGNYENLVLALLMPPDEYDAYELNRAMEGLGTNERALIELLCTRSNKQIIAARDAFQRKYKRNLESELKGETSGHFRRLLVSLVQGARLEDVPLDQNKAVTDARALYQAGEARWGTDESRFNVVMASRSNAQLRLTFDEYAKISKRTMEKAIASEMSGDLKDGMLAIVKCARNRPEFFAERLYKSMKGLGTDDRTLIRIMVTRSEIDMVQIKQEFRKKYGKTLHSFIADDCSGDYKKLLLLLCGGQ